MNIHYIAIFASYLWTVLFIHTDSKLRKLNMNVVL